MQASQMRIVFLRDTFPGTFPEDLDPGRDLLISSDPDLLRTAIARGFAVIGYDESDGGTCSGESFSRFYGIPYVVGSPEALSAAWVRMVWCRIHDLPLEIGASQRIFLRESMPEDFDALFQISREESSCRYTLTMPEDREAALEQFRAYIEKAYDLFGYGLWTIEDRRTGEVIGRCGFTPDEKEDALCLGFLVEASRRRQGIALEACQIALDYAFDVLDAHAVTADCDHENAASIGLLKKLGFSQEPDNVAARGAREDQAPADAATWGAQKQPKPGEILRFRLRRPV